MKPARTGDRRPASETQTRMTDDSEYFGAMSEQAAERYGLDLPLIVHDYWLVRTLHAWRETVGIGFVQRAYPDPKMSPEDNRAGRFVFSGGTALSAAWGITQRWSEDIDMILSPAAGSEPRHLAQACKQAFASTALASASSYQTTEKSSGHHFAAFRRSDAATTRIDVVFRTLEAHPTWIQRQRVMSLIGRMCDDDTLREYPELGGFEMAVLGPGSTAMDKLLAQAKAAMSGKLGLIRERARDVYDLACIARDRARFEGHIGRDSRALLHIAESQRLPADPIRPPDGFGSLRSFDPSTREYEALAEGYERLNAGMVWGEPIPLDEAIRLAVSLDPGPAEAYAPPEPDPLIAYPRH